jgi:hypothetical protein
MGVEAAAGDEGGTSTMRTRAVGARELGARRGTARGTGSRGGILSEGDDEVVDVDCALEQKGNTCSSKYTWRDTITRLVSGSKHLQPFVCTGYPRKIHAIERGESLLGAVAVMFG